MAQQEFVALHGPSNRAYWGTAAPTTGTYQKGDICWNTSPSTGGPAFWICTAAGTPGTWSSPGNLS